MSMDDCILIWSIVKPLKKSLYNRIRKSKKDRQHKALKKDKRTKDDLQNIIPIN